MAPPVVAVLVAHGIDSRVAEALESLTKQTYRDLDVIVVKLAGAEVASTGRRVMVVDGPPHASFPEAVAWGLDNAGGIRAAYVLLVHDDVVLASDAVARMVQHASADGVAAVGAKLVEWDDPGVLQEVGGGLDRFAVRRSALDAGEVDAGQRDDVTDVLYCSDACLLVRADAFAEIGGLDHGAFPLYEDIDLCWRLRASGKRVVVATDARVRHAAVMSRGGRALDAADLAEATERGRLRFILKHFSRFGVAVVLPQLVVAGIARVLTAAVRRQFWQIRTTVRSWASVAREFFKLRHAHRVAHPLVDDRELLSIGARGAILERRHERSEWLSRTVEGGGAFVRRSRVLVRDPVAWGSVAATIVVLLILRGIILGGTFTLGELRPLPTLGGAMSNLFARVRHEGLDPFAPATPGLVPLAVLRTIVLSSALAEKLALLLPLAAAGVGGARIARVLELGPRGRGWLGVAAATNPVTFLFLRDGQLGALAAWAGSVWLVGSLLAPDPHHSAQTERIRFYARWAIAWAVVVSLHPAALIELLAVGIAITVARRDDGHDETRRRALAAGVIGSVVLLAPWSIEWFTMRTPMLGRPGWFVASSSSGVAAATLGAGLAFIGWLLVAYGGAALVGMTRTMLALAFLGALSLLAGVGGILPASTMLVATATCALTMIALAARAIADELPRYELGFRHGLVIAGAGALIAMWFIAAVFFVATGARTRTIPVIATGVKQSGRVLWLSSTTGGIRSWTTTGFGSRLAEFPPPGGSPERLASKAVAAARAGRTHRAGSVLALANISHVVVLDPDAGRGISSQADLSQAEVHDQVVVFRNDSWVGPVVQLTAPPRNPLSPGGLAAAATAPASVPVTGWPSGPIEIGPAATTQGVVYVAGGPRGGWHIGNAKARITAAGEYVPASVLTGTARARPPTGWHILVPLEVILALGALLAWGTAAYLSRPSEPAHSVRRIEPVLPLAQPLVVIPTLAAGIAFLIGFTGASAHAGGGFLSSAWYCPPIGPGFVQNVAIANPDDRATQVVVRPSLPGAPIQSSLLSGHSRTTVSVKSDVGAVVETYGRPIAVAVQVARSGNHDSTLCASNPRELNLFPEGGRAATLAVPRLFERYVIYNPYADVARASVRFLSKSEQIAPPPLQDVQVKPGSFAIVNPEEQFEPMLDLSTVIRVWQGRAVVARRLTTVDQVSWSLSSPSVASGVLPRGITQNATTKVLVLNPFDSPVHITADGFADESTIPQQAFDVDPNSRTSIAVNSFAPQAQGLILNMHADHPVAMEALVVPKGRKGLSLLPVVPPAPTWAVPMMEGRHLVIENPDAKPVHIEAVRLGPGSGQPSVTWTIAAHTTSVSGELPPGEYGMLIRASRPVVVMAYGNDGALAGAPI